MIKYIQRKNIDEAKWDRCIDHSFNGNLYGYTWFLNIVGEEWDALVENDYERVFPVIHRKKFGIHYIYQPFFTQQLGLYSTTKLDKEALGAFLRAIPAHYRHIEINLNTLNKVEDEYKAIPQLNHELDLIHGYDKIREGYSENLVRNLKKAGKAGLTVSMNTRPDDIIELFRRNRGKAIGHLGEKDYLRMKRIAYTAIYKGMASIDGVYNAQNQLVAGAFFIRSHRKAVFLFSGLSEDGRKEGAMPFLIDSYIRRHCGQQITFDFDGSNDQDLARFYRSFGSRECIYQRVMISNLPLLFNFGFKFYKKFKSG